MGTRDKIKPEATLEFPKLGQGTLMSGSASVTTVVTSVSLPDWAVGVRIYPDDGNLRFALNEDPVAVGTLAAPTVGGVLASAVWRDITIEPVDTDSGDVRTLRLLSTLSTATVVEIY